jgi:hypothetical protein
MAIMELKPEGYYSSLISTSLKGRYSTKLAALHDGFVLLYGGGAWGIMHSVGVRKTSSFVFSSDDDSVNDLVGIDKSSGNFVLCMGNELVSLVARKLEEPDPFHVSSSLPFAREYVESDVQLKCDRDDVSLVDSEHFVSFSETSLSLHRYVTNI